MRKAILAGLVLTGFLLSPALLPAEYVVSYNPVPLPTPVILIAPQSPPDAGIGAIALPDVTQHTPEYTKQTEFLSEWDLRLILAQTSWRSYITAQMIQIEDDSWIHDDRQFQFLYALMLCESGGEEQAIGDIDLGVSLGIYQINISYWPLLHKRYNLLDAADNAQAAYVVWKVMGFKAWSCYGGEPVPIQSISN